MKICWDNLEKLKYSNKTGNWRHGNTTYRYKEFCKNCDEPFLYVKRKKEKEFCSIKCSNIYNKKNHTKETKEKISKQKRGKCKNKYHPNWKGGGKYASFNTYSIQLDFCEEVRCKDEDILEVKCTYCGKWFIPTRKKIIDRIQFLKGNITKESRLYCSTSCKKECPIWNQKKWPKDFKNVTSREVQPELRQLVFERDNYECQKCGKTESLHCHHFEGIRQNPIMSADIDNCITVCKWCHVEIHKKKDCTYNDMKCK